MSKNGSSSKPSDLVRAQVIPVWQPAFLAELENTGNLSAACRAAHTRMEAVAHRRRTDREFADKVRALLRARKLDRDPNDRLVEVHPSTIAWDEPWQEDEEYTVEQAFLYVLSRTLNASEACRKVGVSYEAYQRKKGRDLEFARLCSLAVNRACDELEGSLYERALNESDPAAISILRAHRPDVYRTDNTKGGESQGVTLEEAMRRGFERRSLPTGAS